jgi:hypothetical protein
MSEVFINRSKAKTDSKKILKNSKKLICCKKTLRLIKIKLKMQKNTKKSFKKELPESFNKRKL